MMVPDYSARFLTIRERIQKIAAYEVLILIILCMLLALSLCVAHIVVVTRNNGDSPSRN